MFHACGYTFQEEVEDASRVGGASSEKQTFLISLVVH